jgi:hypothetical protein
MPGRNRSRYRGGDLLAASDPPPSSPGLAIPEPSSGGKLDHELGNIATVPGDVRSPEPGLYLGVPWVTAVDRSLQHADSTMVVVLLAGQMGPKRASRRVGGLVPQRAAAGVEVEHPTAQGALSSRQYGQRMPDHVDAFPWV